VADENDPNRPEDDLPPKPPEEAAPADDASSESQSAPEVSAEAELFDEPEAKAPVANAASEAEPEPEPEPVPEADTEPEVVAELEPEFEPEPEPEYIEAPIAAREQAEPTAEPQAALPLSETTADLPPNYFRAAGDPDESEAEAPPSQMGRLKARVEQTARDAWAAMEPGWVKARGATQGALGATWRGVQQVKGPRNVREAAVWSGWVVGGFVALVVGFFVVITWDLPSPDDVWEASTGQSITFLDRNGNVILREGAQNAPPVDLETLPPYVAQAFVAIEDRRFYDHFGIDIGGMMRAATENIRSGRVVQGGSTITQQLAKNLFLSPARSYWRKAEEAVVTVLLEALLPKQRIFELYLNVIEWGNGVFGAEAAAQRYFGIGAAQLSAVQAARLAAMTPSPRVFERRPDSAYLDGRVATILARMPGAVVP
jgi:monofunctional biosynthetic peptidoglycan transglycosylase